MSFFHKKPELLMKDRCSCMAAVPHSHNPGSCPKRPTSIRDGGEYWCDDCWKSEGAGHLISEYYLDRLKK